LAGCRVFLRWDNSAICDFGDRQFFWVFAARDWADLENRA
jgi:hypothetical protein